MSMQLDSDKSVSEWRELMKAANAFYAENRSAQAEMQYVAALRVAEKFSSAEALAGETDEKQHELKVCLAKSLNNMAALYHTQGKYSMAEDLLQRCLELKRELHGDRHMEVAINLHNLAALHSARRRFDQAEPLYKESISIREELLGEMHADLVPVLQNYVLLLRRMHREEDAVEFEERLRRIESASS